MPAYAFVSAKGSPGVTTAAAALAAVGTVQAQTLLVELDPSGGSVQVQAGGGAVFGLVEAAAQLRRDPGNLAAVRDSAVELPAGVRTLLAPAASHTSESVIRSLESRWLRILAACAPLVLVDAGRWAASQRSAPRVGGADLMVAVCHPTLESVEHTRHILQPLRETARQQVAVLVIGTKPYSPEEIAHHLGTPLAGSIAWDPRGAAALWSRGVSRAWLRSRLARSAAATLAGLLEIQPAPPALEAGASGGGGSPAGGTTGPAGRPMPPAGPAPQARPAPPAPPAPPAGPVPVNGGGTSPAPTPTFPPPPPPRPPSEPASGSESAAVSLEPEATDPTAPPSTADRLRAASKEMWK